MYLPHEVCAAPPTYRDFLTSAYQAPLQLCSPTQAVLKPLNDAMRLHDADAARGAAGGP